MISVMYPEIISLVKDIPPGLIPVDLTNSNEPILIIKGMKELLLTAKINSGFDIYLTPVKAGILESICLITAFKDDYDEPLQITTPICRDSFLLWQKLLSLPEFDVYFFNEHSRERMGYRVKNPKYTEAKITFYKSKFIEFSLVSVWIK